MWNLKSLCDAGCFIEPVFPFPPLEVTQKESIAVFRMGSLTPPDVNALGQRPPSNFLPVKFTRVTESHRIRKNGM